MTEKNPDALNEETTNDSATNGVTMTSSIRNNALLLGIFALGCTLFIALTYLSTDEEIEQRIREARLRALLEIVPSNEHDNDMLQDSMEFFDESLGHRDPGRLFLARKNNSLRSLIYPATARDGYSGDIDYIVGINLGDETVAGVRVLAHRETPGLGDKVDLRKSDWILGFNGKSLGNPAPEKWTVSKDGGSFDSFTGATITPRALTKSIASVLQYHQQNSQKLLAQLQQQTTGNTVLSDDSDGPQE